MIASSGIKCPNCGWFEHSVIDSRSGPEESIRRRRECDKCAHRFTTYERTDEATKPLVDAKRERDELLEAFESVRARQADAPA